MVAGVNSLATVLNAGSPLIVENSKQAIVAQKTEPSALSPPKNSDRLADIANAFAPPGNINLLAPSNTSVLLTEQAQQKTEELRNFHPRALPQVGPLGTLDTLKELQNRPVIGVSDGGDVPKPKRPDTPGFTPARQKTGFGVPAPKTDYPSHTAETFKAGIKAFDAAQSQKAAQPQSQNPQYFTSTFSISV